MAGWRRTQAKPCSSSSALMPAASVCGMRRGVTSGTSGALVSAMPTLAMVKAFSLCELS